MKLAKLSLAAIAVVGLSTSSFAADTLADAFQNGKLKGELKAYYFNKDTGTADADIITTGVQLNYVTDSFNGFKMGVTFQSSASPFADTDAKSVFKGDMWGSGAILSEGYLAYTMAQTTVKVGRQFIKTPLLAGSGSRLIKESFEGATVVSNIIPDTTVVLAYVNKYEQRTDFGGSIGKFETFNEDGAYTVAVMNKSVPGLALTAQYADVIDVAKLMYVEAKYTAKMDGFSYNVAGQYLDSAPETNADSDFYGIKVGAGMGALKAYVAYSKTNDDANAVQGLGKGPFGTYYTASVIGSSGGIVNKKGTEAIAIDANYAVTKGAKIGARYVDLSDVNNADDQTRYNVYGSYAFDGALKGFKTDLIYEDQSGDNADLQELWFKAVYKF